MQRGAVAALGHGSTTAANGDEGNTTVTTKVRGTFVRDVTVFWRVVGEFLGRGGANSVAKDHAREEQQRGRCVEATVGAAIEAVVRAECGHGHGSAGETTVAVLPSAIPEVCFFLDRANSSNATLGRLRCFPPSGWRSPDAAGDPLAAFVDSGGAGL